MDTDSEEVGHRREYEEILELQIKEGLAELTRPASGQFLSALACGLHLAVGAFSLFIVLTLANGVLNKFYTQVFQGIVYTFGFIFAIIGETELYTEHTSLALIPVLDGYSSIRELGQLWALVLIGNLIGTGIFAWFGYHAGLGLDIIEPQTFVSVATTFIDLPSTGIFMGAVLAGWLMGLLAWILTAAENTISRIVSIFITTFLIGFGHLPHCVAVSAEMIAGILAGANITLLEYARFEVITILGNTVGGVVFVGLLNYSFAVRGPGKLNIESYSDDEE